MTESANEYEFKSGNRVYPIMYGNRTSKTFLSRLKKGEYDIVKDKAFVFNRSTGRLVKKQSFYTKNGSMRSKYSSSGWKSLEGNPNVVFKAMPKDFKSMFEKHENNFSNEKYYVNAKAYDFSRKSQQQIINEDPAKVKDKIDELKQKGYVELDGSLTQIKNALKTFIGGSKRNGKPSLTGRLYVAYLTKDDLYRKGGFVRSIDLDKEYIAIGTDQGISFSCNLKNVKALYVRNITPKKNEEAEPTVSSSLDAYGTSSID